MIPVWVLLLLLQGNFFKRYFGVRPSMRCIDSYVYVPIEKQLYLNWNIIKILYIYPKNTFQKLHFPKKHLA